MTVDSRASSTIEVATLDVRNTSDRWDDRLPLLLEAMAALQPDVLGLQECIFPLQQDRLIASAGAAHYRVHRGWTLEVEIGNSLLVREPLTAPSATRLDLGHGRSAVVALVTLPDGARSVVASTQLHHAPDGGAIRAAQVGMLVGWLADAFPPRDATIVCAVLNDRPGAAGHAAMVASGYRSAHAEANGAEASRTWPSGSLAERSGGRAWRQGYWLAQAEPGTEEPGCFDYIWVSGRVAVESCDVAFDRPASDDPGLFPSDHLGLWARLTVGTT